MKRLLGLALTLIMIVTILPESWGGTQVKAEGTVRDSGTCGPNLTWELSYSGVLTISGTGAMDDYPLQSMQLPQYPWRRYNPSIHTVVIEEGVTYIGENAFFGSFVQYVTLPSTLTAIGRSAFYQSDLMEIELPASLKTIGHSAFCRCRNLQEITIPESVTLIDEYAFSACDGLLSIEIPAGTSVGKLAFESCFSLQTAVIKNKKMTEIPEGLFLACSSLSSVVIPESVTSIGWKAFYKCSQLQQISIPKKVTSISKYAFDGCSALAKVNYGGGQSDWNSISIGDYNDPLLTAAVSYYSYNPFTDVSESAWYCKPVLWAYNHGVTSGTTATTFDPNKNCTRAEFVTFLYKFVGKPWKAAWASECSFSDVKTSDWYYRAVVWANHAGVTHGTGGGKFSPNVTLDRGMVISFLYNMEKYQNGTPKVTLTGTKFTDVTSDKYYYRPVLWAEQYKITNGTSATTFSPAKKCTRAEAVAFLYNISKYWER